MRRISLIASVFAVLALAGCAVGPNYKRPRVSIPEKWTVAPARGTSSKQPTTDEWWSSFNDPELNSLIERAVKRNLDLKLALERVEEARAARGVARSGYFPSVDADASTVRLRGGFNQGVIRALPSSNNMNASPSLISPFETNVFQGNLSAIWELDVFGAIRRGVQASRADMVAQQENRRDVLVILLGDVGNNYAQLRGFQRRLQIADKNIQTQHETLELTEARAKAGLVTLGSGV
ncbi:MAG: TolC family protein [Acidobacteriota bacterium]|nr:TolC family protein [Acidobacteriota bacterium]